MCKYSLHAHPSFNRSHRPPTAAATRRPPPQPRRCCPSAPPSPALARGPPQLRPPMLLLTAGRPRCCVADQVGDAAICIYTDSKKEHLYPGEMVVLRYVDDTNKLKVSIWLRHTLNFQDMGMRSVRGKLVLQEMIRVLKDLDIEYLMLPLDVNV
ncbi:hypothetical protein QYE76_007394 [Lolium multiflorum]|uniref:Uncharacterized protein n=1 Tax=Lolium multiflorum TaxID=4521 RepID=A0AAD8W492_LOLMU|nr:hypothetical protein QYE76_007394 [Lolium multiflorum]